MSLSHVMVWFLVACYGDSRVAAQHGTAVVGPASNQRPANELPHHPLALLDYANRGENHPEPLRTGKISHEIRRSSEEQRLIGEQDVRGRVDYAANGSAAEEKRRQRVESEFSSPEMDQRLKFSYNPDEKRNLRTSQFKRSPPATAAIGDENTNNTKLIPIAVTRSNQPLVSPIRRNAGANNEAATMTEHNSSPETDERLKFSSVYSKADLDEKLCKTKDTFNNHLSDYASDGVDSTKNVANVDSEASINEYENSRDPSLENNISEAAIDKAQRKQGSVPNTKKSSGAEEEARSPHSENQNNPRRKTTAVKAGLELGVEHKNETFTSESLPPRSLLGVAGMGVPVAYMLHQQSTNMKPTRTQHLEQNKRSTGEATLAKIPVYGMGGPTRRQSTADVSPLSTRGNVQLNALHAIQLNAAAAYHNAAQPLQSPFNNPVRSSPSLSDNIHHTLYQFNPSQINTLRGVFDGGPAPGPNFHPIPPKQVAYVPPRIVYETKIVPTPFMPFRTEEKTVQALSSLLGQSPQQQLQGLNLILNKEQKDIANLQPIESHDFNEELTVSEKPDALGQQFVTPITTSDVRLTLNDDDVHGNVNRGPSNYGSTTYHETRLQGNAVNAEEQQSNYRPITENEEKTVHLTQSVSERPWSPSPPAVWEETEFPEVVEGKEEGRYRPYGEHEDELVDYAGKYMFGYQVTDHESGNNFGHEETRDGEITKGKYHVLLPDGRIQNVKYHVDHEGYHAKVSYQLNHSH